MESTQIKEAVNQLEEEEIKHQKTFQLIVFRLGKEEYALYINQIKEVVLTPNITKMPQTPEYIKGVANIRGNIIAILDLEEKLGIEKVKENEPNGFYTLVVESDNLKLGILSTEVPNTLTVAENNIEETGNLVNSDHSSGYIQGVVKLEDRLIILIDIFKVISETDLKGLK